MSLFSIHIELMHSFTLSGVAETLHAVLFASPNVFAELDRKLEDNTHLIGMLASVDTSVQVQGNFVL
jgi:hypothetical protein